MDDRAAKIQATRDKEMERVRTSKVLGPLPGKFSTSVVGVSFVPTYPHNLYDLEQAALNAGLLGEQLVVVLIRDPANEYDPNAVQVHVPALGSSGMVGHLTRPVAARLAPELDDGAIWQGVVEFVKINHDHLDRPGIEIHLERRQHG